MRSPMRLDLPGSPARRDRTPRRVSDCLASWHGASGTLDSDQGVAGVFARATTLASVSDGAGSTYTAPHSLPAWEMRDLDGDSVREAMGLRMATSDFLTWGVAPLPQVHSGLLEFVEVGGVTGTSGATLWAICNDAVSGVRMWIDTSGSAGGDYGLNWNNGSTTRTARLTVAPTSGQRVRLRWTWAADGAIAIWQSINGGAETTATAAALALPSAWGTGAVMRLNSRGDTENPCQAFYRRLKLVPGIVDVATLEAIR
jgi:hypothetical protein